MQGDALQRIVDGAASNVDRYLLHSVRDASGFLRHCGALRQYLFADAGDFAAALLAAIGPELDGKVHACSLILFWL